MTLITCRNGHRYDPSLTSECPECAMLKNIGTVPLMDTPEAGLDGTYRYKTRDIGTTGGGYGGTVELSRDEIPGFKPVTPANGTAKAADIPVKTDVTVDNKRSGSYGSTVAVDRSGNFISRSEQPITGWLVCIDGPEKGKDYRLHDENNFIGRSSRMDVCIAGDRTVSEERHAVITYDSQEKKFYFALSGGSSIVRLNGKAVLMTQEVQYGDRIQIGQGTFLFIPLCGEKFQWEN